MRAIIIALCLLVTKDLIKFYFAKRSIANKKHMIVKGDIELVKKVVKHCGVRCVPIVDHEMMKFIRLKLANGENVIYDAESFDDSEWQFKNAKILKDWYGMTAQEVLEETGFHVSENK